MSLSPYPDNYPVWFVICTIERVGNMNVYTVIRSTPCFINHINELFYKHTLQLIEDGKQVQTFVVKRDIENPFNSHTQQ